MPPRQTRISHFHRLHGLAFLLWHTLVCLEKPFKLSSWKITVQQITCPLEEGRLIISAENLVEEANMKENARLCSLGSRIFSMVAAPGAGLQETPELPGQRPQPVTAPSSSIPAGQQLLVSGSEKVWTRSGNLVHNVAVWVNRQPTRCSAGKPRTVPFWPSLWKSLLYPASS